MSNARIFWIAWCTMWALGWMLIGFFTLFLGWIMVPISLLAILIPIGTGGAPAVSVILPPADPRMHWPHPTALPPGHVSPRSQEPPR